MTTTTTTMSRTKFLLVLVNLLSSGGLLPSSHAQQSSPVIERVLHDIGISRTSHGIGTPGYNLLDLARQGIATDPTVVLAVAGLVGIGVVVAEGISYINQRNNNDQITANSNQITTNAGRVNTVCNSLTAMAAVNTVTMTMANSAAYNEYAQAVNAIINAASTC